MLDSDEAHDWEHIEKHFNEKVFRTFAIGKDRIRIDSKLVEGDNNE